MVLLGTMYSGGCVVVVLDVEVVEEVEVVVEAVVVVVVVDAAGDRTSIE